MEEEKIIQMSHVKVHCEVEDIDTTYTYVLTNKGRMLYAPTDLESPDNWIDVDLPDFSVDHH